MLKKPKQLAFKIKTWGGKRRGAGRPNRSGRINHMKRARVDCKQPLLLTIKLKGDKWNLRCSEIVTAFEASAEAAKKFGLRVLHYSIQGNHLHILVEAKNNISLTRGMRSFGSRLGKAIRKVVGGRGPVFLGRFHLQVITNPTQMRNALAYVLQNSSKHSKLIHHVDFYSSAPYFCKWKELLRSRAGPILEATNTKAITLPAFLCAPQSWLAREGWMRAWQA